MLVLFSSWIPGILENPLFFTFFLPFFHTHFFLPVFYLFFTCFFTFSEVKVDFSHVGPVFLLDSRNFGKSIFFYLFFTFFLPFFHVFRGKSWFFTCWSCFPPGFPEFWKIHFFLHFFFAFFSHPLFFTFFLHFFLHFFHVFRGKSWFFTCWLCFPPGFPEFWKIHFFLPFFYIFFTFSEVKVDFSHVGPVFLLDSRNFGKSIFFYLFFTFFLPFFHVFRGKSWFFTCWSCFPPGFPEFWKIHFFLLFFTFFSHPLFFTFFLHFFYLFFTFSEVKVDFSHVGPVFLLDSRNFGKSTFFYLFFTFFFTFFSRFPR